MEWTYEGGVASASRYCHTCQTIHIGIGSFDYIVVKIADSTVGVSVRLTISRQTV